MRRHGLEAVGTDYGDAARNLGEVLAATRRAVLRAGEQEAEAIAADASAAAPVRTGELRASYRTRPGDRPGVTEVVTFAEHAPYVEWGTSDTEAQPHLRPAVARSRQRLPGRVVDEARRVRRPR